MRGRFITFEGLDGAGKSTHIHWCVQRLRQRGTDVVLTREPGGTPLGEKLRELLLDPAFSMQPETETLLMFAARREHIQQIIMPALQGGGWVLSDRFTDASFTYQGAGRGVDSGMLTTLQRWVQGELEPDLTLYFDVPARVGRERVKAIKPLDRFEQEQEAFFDRVRQAYLARANEFPHRIRTLDATKSPVEIQVKLEEIISSI